MSGLRISSDVSCQSHSRGPLTRGVLSSGHQVMNILEGGEEREWSERMNEVEREGEGRRGRGRRRGSGCRILLVVVEICWFQGHHRAVY